MTITDPLTCGFAKVAGFKILTEEHNLKKEASETPKLFQGRINKFQYEKYKQYFSNNDQFMVNYKVFTDKFRNIVQSFYQLKGNKQIQIKDDILHTFSKENWDELSNKKKAEHSYIDCNGCLKDAKLKAVQAKFPVKSIRLKAKATKAGLYKERILSDITNQIVNNANTYFQENHKTSFVKQAKKHVESFKEIDQTKFTKQVVKDIESQYNETSLDRLDKLNYEILYLNRKNIRKRNFH